MKPVPRQVADFVSAHSLRTRFMYAASLLTVIVLSSAWFAGRYVSEVSQETARNLGARSEVQHASRSLRNTLWKAQYALQNFALTPGATERQAVGQYLETAAGVSEHLHGSMWISEHRLSAITAGIVSDLRRVQMQAGELMDVRQDINSPFPTPSQLDEILSPDAKGFLIVLQRALEQIDRDSEPGLEEIRERLEQVRHSWSQMITAFRAYAVQRAASYAAGSQGQQLAGYDITILHQDLIRYLNELALKLGPTQGNLRIGDSVLEMTALAREWFDGFNRFRMMQESNGWRSAIPHLENGVQPLFVRIEGGLHQIESHLDATAQHEVSGWAAIGQNLIQNIWVLSLLALCVIAISYWYVEHAVLAPLSQLSRAMNAIASGEEHASLPEPPILEARHLIDAFAQMKDKVHERHVELERRTLHDALTGLPNRVLMMDRLRQEILKGKRNGPSFCLLIMDLDRFKEVNDGLGHQTGDRVLCEVGGRLNQLLRETDTVARLGGDEFSVLLPDSGVRQAQEIAQVIANSLQQPFEFDDKHLLLGVSIGIAVFPDHGKEADSLIRCADVAMYVAKENGLSHSVYNVQQDHNSVGRLAMISGLRQAIDRDELDLYYQPKVDMGSGRVVGLEALLRWPEWSSVPTKYLIQAAEQTGLIRPLTQWVLHSVLRQYARWQDRGWSLAVSVNISNWTLQQGELREQIESLLSECRVPAAALELEIKENAVMRNPDRALAAVEELHCLGVKITLDDYGTGFSSLAYLKQMPVDKLKIDSSFVMDMFEDEDSAVIVRSTIDLAHNLGLEVVAEGVSTQEVWDLLAVFNCDIAQGYLVAQPMPADDIEAWLGAHYPHRAGYSG
jgi:diguanylate cyclase (GGDEF)-like protein